MAKGAFILSMMLMFFSGCAHSTGAESDDPSLTLRSAADGRDILLGAAASVKHLDESAYTTSLIEEFNTLVAENCMKFKYLQPNEGFFTFEDADKLVSFAEANSMKVRGHTLLWHSDYQISEWVKNRPYSDMQKVAEDHIEAVMTHFQGKIYAWDVANEILVDRNPPVFRSRFAGGSDYSVWAKDDDDDSVVKAAFYKADKVRKALNDDVKLFLCDYNNEEKGHHKADRTFEIIKQWVEEGVPIDGVAFQMHLIGNNPPNYQAIRDNIDRYQALGLEVQFTEIDVRIPEEAQRRDFKAQERVYGEILKIALDKNIETFIVWGVTDKYSWIPHTFKGQGNALLLDSEYSKKGAYRALLKRLQK